MLSALAPAALFQRLSISVSGLEPDRDMNVINGADYAFIMAPLPW